MPTDHPTTVVVFAKAPVPGFAKTRLIPALGAEGAAALAHRLLNDTLAMVQSSGIGPAELCAAPDYSDAAWQAVRIPSGIAVTSQGEGDLGERLARAVQRVLNVSDRVLLIGTDGIDLTPALLQQAAAALDKVDAVIYPAQDGGYVLLGLKRFDSTLFTDIAWSTASVCSTTIERIQTLNWSLQVGKTLRDLDEPEDLVYV